MYYLLIYSFLRNISVIYPLGEALKIFVMSDRDLKLLIRIIRFMQQHPQAYVSQDVGADDIDERLSALLNAEISEENIHQSIPTTAQDFENNIPPDTTPLKGVKGVDNEVFEQLTEENDALKEQVSSMSEMMELTLRHVDSTFDERLDKERKLLKEVEENLQENLFAQEEMMAMTIKYIDANSHNQFDGERKAFKEIEENLQEHLSAQEGMMAITIKHFQEEYAGKLDRERKDLKEIEEGLQEEIAVTRDMMEMTIKYMLQHYRSEEEVDEIIKEYKTIEESLQEQIISQQEMMAMTIKHLEHGQTKDEVSEPPTQQPIASEAQADQPIATESEDLVQVQNNKEQTEVDLSPEKESVDSIKHHIQEEKPVIKPEESKVTATADNEAVSFTHIENDKHTLDVAHKVFKEYIDLPAKLNTNFKTHFLAEYMHKGNSRAYLYVRSMRNTTFIILVDSLLEGVSSIVFNSLSSMLLHHLIVERRIENTADLIQEFIKGTTSVYESIGETAKDTNVSILSISKSAFEIEFASTGNVLFYAQQDKYRILNSGKNTNKKMNDPAFQVSRVNGKKGAVIYMCSQAVDTTYVKAGGGNFMSLQEMLINTYQLEFTEQKDNLSGYMQELQPENQADNTLIFGLNL
jgi:hypothetical protein